MNAEDSVLASIAELVDDQLDRYADRSGYDHNVGQPKCRCGDDWHGLPITEQMRMMRTAYSYGVGEALLESYDHSADQSPVVCPGSDVHGPLRANRRASPGFVGAPRYYDRADGRPFSRRPFNWTVTVGDQTPDPVRVRYFNADFEEESVAGGTIVGPDTPGFSDGGFISPETWVSPHHLHAYMVNPSRRIARTASFRISEEDLDLFFGPAARPEPQQTPQQRALPRPSTTPPMWAHDPTRSRRRR